MPVDIGVRSFILTDKVKGWTTIPNDANMEAGFAPVFRNIVLTKQGVISMRNGSAVVNDTAITDAPDIFTLMEWMPTSASDTKQKLVGTSDGKVYRLDAGNVFTLVKSGLTASTRLGWFNFKGKLYFSDGITTSQQYDGTSASDWIATSPTALPKWKFGHVHESRIFLGGGSEMETMEVRYNHLNDADNWEVDGDDEAAAGIINMSIELSFGDVVTSINSHKGFLIFYMKQHIAIWTLGTNQLALTLTALIRGQGCHALNGQELIGNDAYFWTRYGIKSLAETANTNNIELDQDISEPIDNELEERLDAIIEAGNEDHISIVHYPRRSVVIINYPIKADLSEYRQAVYNYNFKVWSEWTKLNFNVLFVDSDNVLYGGGTDGHLYQLDTGTDDSGARIEFEWETPWLYLRSFERIKDMDAAQAVLENVDPATLDVRWYFDFDESTDTENTDTWQFEGGGPYFLESGLDPVFAFGGSWSGSGKSSPLPFPLFGYGQVVKFKFSNSNVNEPFSIEYLRLDYTLGGRATGR
jgi:hypothetical protein